MQNTFLLSSASAWGLVIQFLAAPVLSRIYTPEVYGTFAVFGTFLNVVMTLITLGFHRALLLPRSDDSMRSLLRLSIYVALIASSLSQLVFVFFGPSILAFFAVENIGSWVYLIAPLALLGALDQYVVSWTMQARAFRKSSAASVPINAASKGFNIAYGKFVSAGVDGLIITHLLTAALRIGVHLRWVIDRVKPVLFGAVSGSSLRATWKEYSDYPKYMVWGQLLNQLSNYLPILMLPIFLTGTAAVGFYTYALMILELPIRLLGAGLTPVYLQEAADLWNTDNERLRSKTRRLFNYLFLVSLPAVLVLTLIGEPLFAWLFSEEWRMAGQAAALLAFSYLFRYVSVPISGVFTVTRHERAQLVFQGLLFLARLAGIGIPGYFGGDFLAMMFGFALANALAYTIYTLWIFKLIQHPLGGIFLRLAATGILGMVWVAWRFGYLPIAF